MASKKACPEKTLKPYYHKKLSINVLVRPYQGAKNRFKRPEDTSGVELSDFETS